MILLGSSGLTLFCLVGVQILVSIFLLSFVVVDHQGDIGLCRDCCYAGPGHVRLPYAPHDDVHSPGDLPGFRSRRHQVTGRFPGDERDQQPLKCTPGLSTER